MFLLIGKIIKAQGIKGEVKVKPLPSDYSYFKKLKLVCLDAIPHKLRSVSLRSGFAYMSFEGISDRSGAEILVGKSVEIDKRDVPSLSRGEYFIDDIIGCNVSLSDGREIGKVVDISKFGAADVYTVSGDRVVRFPLLKRIIIDISLEEKAIVLDAVGFDEVSVYED